MASSNFRGSLLKLNSDILISNNSETAINWDATEYDTDSFWSSSNKDRITIPAGISKVRFSASVIWDDHEAGERVLFLKKNGNYEPQGRSVDTRLPGVQVSSNQPLVHFSGQDINSAVFDVSPGDYFTLNVYHNSGNDRTIFTNNATWFALEVVEQVSNSTGPRNKIINGNFNIWQRGTPFVSPTEGTFTSDRWKWSDIGAGSVTISQETSIVPNGVGSSMKIAVTATDTLVDPAQRYFIEQGIEGYNVSDILSGTANAKQITVSFWVRSPKTGSHYIFLRNGAFTRTYPASYIVSVADTWEKKEITLTADTTGVWESTNLAGLRIGWTLAAGATPLGTANTWQSANVVGAPGLVNIMGSTSNNFYLAEVQVEIGGTATEFEHRLIGNELALCQRYYEIYGGSGNSPNFQGYSVAGDQTIPYAFKVEKRVAPTATKFGTWTTVNCGQPTVPGQTNIRHASIRTNVTATGIFEVYPNASTDRITFDAEI